MEAFFRTHKYLLEHTDTSVRRQLMDEINWDDRLIGIKGSRGVGKTMFLLDYAREHFGANDRTCLYVNLNQFCFTERTLIDFAMEFRARGGRVLLIDQVFKYPNWSQELRYLYEKMPDLKIVFTGSSVMRLKEENVDLSGCVVSYNLRGFSFREFLNLMARKKLPSYQLEDLLENHIEIARSICKEVKPLAYFQDYLHHGYYPFFLEKRNFSENLLKTMNMILEVDVLFIKQVEQNYLHKLRKLLYLLAIDTPSSPNVTQLSKEIETSRATVMNYFKYLTDARLTNMLYAEGDSFPKKPIKIYMNNSNLLYPINPISTDKQAVRETFFYNQLHHAHKLNIGDRNTGFKVDGKWSFSVEEFIKSKKKATNYYAVDKLEIGTENRIPLWLFGFLY